MYDPIFLTFFTAGALGALVNDILKDNALELPKRVDGKLILGFIGSIILGGVAGYYIDGSILTAFMGGFMGKAVIEGLVPKGRQNLLDLIKENKEEKPKEIEKKTFTLEDIKDLIIKTAKQYGVDKNLALRVAKCESAYNPNAININKTGSKDRGLYQWNDKWHPEITDDMAFDPQCAAKLFCQAVKAGNLSWWNASKKCWNK